MKVKLTKHSVINVALALTLLFGWLSLLIVPSHAETLGAPPENLKVPPMAYDENKIVLMWDKPEDYYANGQDPTAVRITDYEVYINDQLAGTAHESFHENYPYLSTYKKAFYEGTTGHHQIDIHSYTATGLTPDTDYTFKVRAINSDGTFSSFSASLTHRTAKEPVIVDVTQYGATYITSTDGNYTVKGAGGDEATITAIEENTKALQAAIDAVTHGGKVVLKGSGDNANPYYYVSGSLFLHSNMTFEIEEGAVLFGSPVFDHYSRNLLVYPYSQDIRTHGLLNAVTWDTGTLENIRIVGNGAIDGNGWKRAASPWQEKNSLDPNPQTSITDPTGNNWELPNYFAGNNSSVSEQGILAGDAMDKSRLDQTPNSGVSQWYNTRPNLIIARGVNGLYYEGLTFYNPAFHGVVNYHSQGIVTNGTISLTYNTNNGDGLEYGDCHDIYILNNFLDTGDDAINFASGQGTTVRNETDRVASGEGVVFNNYVRNGHGGLLAIGSHVGGFIGDLKAEDNLYNTSERGSAGALRMKASAITGGGIRNIIFRDNALHYSVNASNPITIDTAYSDSNASTAFGPESDLPLIYENIDIRNLTISNLESNLMTIHEPSTSIISKKPIIREFHLSDITVLSGTGGDISLHSLQNSSFKNINRDIDLTNTKNIHIENCGNTPDQVPADISWQEGSELLVAVDGVSLDISYPNVPNASQYRLLIDMLDGYGYQEKGVYTTEEIQNIVLAPSTDYTIAIRPETEDSYGPLLETSIRTTEGAITHSTMVSPSDTSLNPRGLSGISWQALTWENAEDPTYGIHYYELTAVSETGDTKTYKAYFDHDTRQGYALWGLNAGESYNVTMKAVNWAGQSVEYGSYLFTTVPGTLVDIPRWSPDSTLHVESEKRYGEDIEIQWDENHVTEFSNGDTDIFAGYRVLLNGIIQQPENGKLDQTNALPTVAPGTNSYVLSTYDLLPNTRYVVSVEAGNEILKYASGSGGLNGSTPFTGTNPETANLARNQVTFGKWTGHGPKIKLYFEAMVLNNDEESSLTMNIGDSLQLATEFGKMHWTVEDSTVATISEHGYLTALTGGSTTITATNDAGFTATLILTVTAEATNNRPDMSQLESYYHQVKDTINEGYTETSWKQFQEALEKAKHVLANTEATQELVDNTLHQLITAYEGLTLEKPEGEKGPDNDDNLVIENDSQLGVIDILPGPTTTNPGVNTGDYTPIYLILTLCITSGFILAIKYKKQ